jgi:hypothetical protein
MKLLIMLAACFHANILFGLFHPEDGSVVLPKRRLTLSRLHGVIFQPGMLVLYRKTVHGRFLPDRFQFITHIQTTIPIHTICGVDSTAEHLMRW